MISPLHSFTKSKFSDTLIPLAQAQAWLQNALNALYYGADAAQATAMLRKVEEYLNTAAHSTGSTFIEPSHYPSILRFGIKTDRGNKRRGKPNEDNFFAITGSLPSPPHLPFGLFIVADGMGGHSNGQMASSMVIQQLADVIIPRLLAGDQQIHALLVDGIQNAHQAILERNQRTTTAEMGSLVTAALIISNVATIANVGDSRTYLYRPGHNLLQITLDHSVVATMVKAGLIGREDVYTHPRRNEVYRSLGTQQNSVVEVDLFTLELEDGDKLLLCSDGVWEMVRDTEIEALLQEPEEPAGTAHKLYQASLEGGGQDNIGIIVVEYGMLMQETEPLPIPLQEEQNTNPPIGEKDSTDRPLTTFLPSMPKA